VKLDLLLDPFGARPEDLRRAARTAETLGFDGLWTWDHLAGSVHGERSAHESWTVLSTWAAITERVTIGPLVLNVANRNPALVAVMAATLQDLSGGRLLLGLGAGGGTDTPYADEQRVLRQTVGTDPERRRAVRNAVALLRQAWTGWAEGVGGLLVPEPPPPIVVGGFGPRMADLAGEVGDGFNTQAGHPRLAELGEAARAAHGRSGRDGPFLLTAFAGLDPRWYRAGSAGWRRAAAAGVDRLILIVSPPYEDAWLEAAAPVSD
jgi:alkanesulfonate monooxygenase SsuD/methylene tetrahydromethanopterin reductase-like flavin-dependent oxidoreductase (luciferase family)